MKRKVFALLSIFTSLMLFSCQLFAQSGFDIIGKNYFELAKKDVSFQLLGHIFGQVGTVLTANQTIMNAMFSEFNKALLVLAVIIIMYTLIMSIVHTAHEGEFLGKKFDSLWVPIRSVTGVALLAPMPTIGYSVIQVFFMWIVIQGIRAADVLWDRVLDYIMKTGTVVTAPSPSLNADGIGTAKSVLAKAVCLQRDAENYGLKSGVSPNFYERADASGNVLKQGYNFDFFPPNNVPGSSGGTSATNEMYNCGQLEWEAPDAPNLSDLQKEKDQALSEGMVEAVDALNKVASTYVFDNKNLPIYDSQTNPVLNAAIVIKNKLFNVQATSENVSDINTELIAAKDYGWIYAGAYYHVIASYTDSRNDLLTISVQSPTDLGVSQDPTLDPADQNFVNDLASIASSPDISMPNNLGAWGASSASGSWMFKVMRIVYIPFNYIVSIFTSLITGQASEFTTSPNDPHSLPLMKFFAGEGEYVTVDPLIRLQQLGENILSAVTGFYILGIIYLLGFVFYTGWCSALTPVATLMQGAYRYIVNPIIWLLGLLFMSGLSLAVYLPLVPYIIFTFTAIGWMIAVIETMIAAPLVALGVTNPDPGSHSQVFGRAEPAIQLITNVFLRPSMMIFGLIGGMLLTFVAVDLLNNSYFFFIGTVAEQKGMDPLRFIMFLVMYIVLMVAIVNRTFSLIHLIPDRVLSWIGWQGQFGAYSEGMEGIAKQGFQSLSGKVSSATGKAASMGSEFGQGVMKGQMARMKAKQSKAGAVLGAKAGGLVAGPAGAAAGGKMGEKAAQKPAPGQKPAAGGGSGESDPKAPPSGGGSNPSR